MWQTNKDYIGIYYDSNGSQQMLVPKGTPPSVAYTDTADLGFIFEDCQKKYGFKVDTDKGAVFVPAENWTRTPSITIAGRVLPWETWYWGVAVVVVLFLIFKK